MRLDVWLPMYRAICREFGYLEQDDLVSAVYLASILEHDSAGVVSDVRTGFPDTVVVCGCGDTLAEDCRHLSVDDYVIAADGATSEVLSAGIRPQIIVSDLDGIVGDQIEASFKGSQVFVHAHGDNVAAIERYVAQFGGTVAGTCQCPPVPGLVNFGGFTDGDRSVCLAEELGARQVLLAGFELSRPSYKEGRDLEVKGRKLGWARRVLEVLKEGGLEMDTIRNR